MRSFSIVRAARWATFAMIGVCAASTVVAQPAPAATQPAATQGAISSVPVRRLNPDEARNAQPQPPPPAVVEGPMRLELLGIIEQRVLVVGDVGDRAPKPAFRIFFKFTGARLGDVFRVGRIVVDEFVDEAGTSLVDLSTFTDKEKTETSPVQGWQNVLQQGYSTLDINGLPTLRTSQKIKSARGYVNAILGSKEREVMIDGPTQFAGGVIKSDALKELGIEIRVLTPGTDTQDAADGKGICLRIESGEDRIRSIEFFDDYLRRMNSRPRASVANDEKPYSYYTTAQGVFNADTMMVVNAYESVEPMRVEFKLSDVSLP